MLLLLTNLPNVTEFGLLVYFLLIWSKMHILQFQGENDDLNDDIWLKHNNRSFLKIMSKK